MSNVSHEIRTPMNSILGLSHILLNSDLTSEQKR
ncbi:histidine kinase dimerization/phospho-acceptor domain-containing protein [Vibrio sp. M60_M31a]